MTKDGKHDCFNRERRDAYLGASGRSIPDRSSKECQYSKDVVDQHCVGCKHNRQATEGRKLYETVQGLQKGVL